MRAEGEQAKPTARGAIRQRATQAYQGFKTLQQETYAMVDAQLACAERLRGAMGEHLPLCIEELAAFLEDFRTDLADEHEVDRAVRAMATANVPSASEHIHLTALRGKARFIHLSLIEGLKYAVECNHGLLALWESAESEAGTVKLHPLAQPKIMQEILLFQEELSLMGDQLHAKTQEYKALVTHSPTQMESTLLAGEQALSMLDRLLQSPPASRERGA